MSRALRAQLQSSALSPSTDSVRAFLTGTLRSRRARARIVEIEREPCAYGSSWWLENITLHLDDGSEIRLVFKDLSREATGSGARRVKPSFVIDPEREAWTYRTLLAEAPPAPPRLWAALSDCDTGRHWLFLERVSGVRLSEIGEPAAWRAAAHWLGRFHATSYVPHANAPILRHDQDYHRGWLARALFAAHENVRKDAGDIAREKLARLRKLAPVHERAVNETVANGYAVIHGEFYASNVLAAPCDSTYTIHAVDWETTALGAPLLDLAALTSGRWKRNDRIAMTKAYREGKRGAGAQCWELDECLHLVTACRLLLAVQWLGWAAGWTAPVDHRNDWLEEAERCAEELRG